MSSGEWVQILTSGATFLGVTALLVKNAGVWQHTRESNDEQLAERVVKLETEQVEDHAYIGRVNTLVTRHDEKIEAHANDIRELRASVFKPR